MDGVSARLLGRAADLPADSWNRLAAGDQANAVARPAMVDSPFATHAFYTSLEDSGSATAQTGWQPLHILLEGADGAPVGLLPGYVKSHSQGEYVFDHNWADAYAQAGGAYYPKLQHATPFTPATSAHLMAADPAMRRQLLALSEAVVRENGLSSAHLTFPDARDQAALQAQGWLERHDIQYHWHNRGWTGFADFLDALSSRKRKALRKEREAALAGIDEIVWLTGPDLSEAAWDAFYAFYLDTGSRKWGRPYLTRAFFSLIGARMGDRILLVMAKKGGRYVAGALNFIGSDTLFGRQWGCVEDIPFLHFELCYHQAIDFACQKGLRTVQAGAQGAHKIARGYEPVISPSYHYIAPAGLRAAVAAYLPRERAAYAQALQLQQAELPFKNG